LRYREIAFTPTTHPDLGYREMLAGITDGIDAAERDLGVTSRLIVAVNREQSPSVAADLLRTVAAHPSDYVVGIGLDHNERAGPPEAFREAYEIAESAGLRRTAHAGERGDVAEVAASIDVLGVDEWTTATPFSGRLTCSGRASTVGSTSPRAGGRRSSTAAGMPLPHPSA
jgi:adenosine deaminase